MARTDEAAVRSVLSTAENTAVTTAQVNAAIEAATVIVDRLADAPCHSDASLELVERYLAADIVVQTAGGGELVSEKIGDAAETRNKSKDGKTSYMLTAQRLDCSGQLADFAKPAAFINLFGGAWDYDA